MKSATSVFDRTLHVGRPNIGSREVLFSQLNTVLDRAWLTNQGPLVAELEDQLSTTLGVRHCILTCNGTMALSLAIRALNLSGEVIVPSFTFVATAHALQWQGIRPVFCDIAPDSYTLDPEEIERHITPRTTGILGVHLYGHPCAVDRLETLAQKHNLQLLFDAAHAFGCSYQGRRIGNFGRCEVFSFHTTKFFNTIEGGAITTNDDALADTLRLMKNFGFSGYDNVIDLGVNGKMNEFCAAMGLTNLKSLATFLHCNKRNYDAYRQRFAQIPGLTMVEVDDREDNNRQYIVVEVDDSFPLSRDALMQRLHAENILVRRYFWPGCHRMEPYRTLYPDVATTLPVTERKAQRVLLFPTGTAVGEREIERIDKICRNPQIPIKEREHARSQRSHALL